MHERGEGDGPAAVDVAEAVVVGDRDAGEEHLVEGRPAGHLAQGADVDPGGVHVDHEGGQVAVAGPGRRAGEEEPDVAVVGSGGPDLLAVDGPVVAVGHGSRGDAGEV